MEINWLFLIFFFSSLSIKRLTYHWFVFGALLSFSNRLKHVKLSRKTHTHIWRTKHWFIFTLVTCHVDKFIFTIKCFKLPNLFKNIIYYNYSSRGSLIRMFTKIQPIFVFLKFLGIRKLPLETIPLVFFLICYYRVEYIGTSIKQYVYPKILLHYNLYCFILLS